MPVLFSNIKFIISPFYVNYKFKKYKQIQKVFTEMHVKCIIKVYFIGFLDTQYSILSLTVTIMYPVYVHVYIILYNENGFYEKKIKMARSGLHNE